MPQENHVRCLWTCLEHIQCDLTDLRLFNLKLSNKFIDIFQYLATKSFQNMKRALLDQLTRPRPTRSCFKPHLVAIHDLWEYECWDSLIDIWIGMMKEYCVYM